MLKTGKIAINTNFLKLYIALQNTKTYINSYDCIRNINSNSIKG